MVGNFTGTFGGRTSLGDQDIFVRKLDATGNAIWTTSLGTSAYDFPWRATLDSAGSILIVGVTYGSLPGHSNAGGMDGLVARFDANGGLVWLDQIGTAMLDFPRAVVSDPQGNLYVAGQSDIPLPGQVGLGGVDGFLRKYDPSGNVLWTKSLGTSEFDAAYALDMDGQGDLVVAVTTSGALPGYTNRGLRDAVVLKLTTDGTQIWARQFGSAGYDDAFHITTDSAGAIYVGGNTSDTLTSEPDAYSRVFVRKYSSDGIEQWTRQLTGSDGTSIGAISAGNGGICVSGSTTGTIPGQTSKGDTDAFVARILP